MWTELLTEQHLAPLVHACRWLVLDRPLPPALFKTFLRRRLAGSHPDLAERVAALQPNQLEQLTGRLRERQCLSRSLVYG